jgi:hypothetical protein
MMRGLCLFLATICLPLAAHADYDASEIELVRTAEGIVDATVIGFTPEGHAQLKIHAHWVGQVAPLVKSVSYTCLLGSAKEAGLKLNQRYVIIIDTQGNLFEETTYYPIKDGQVKGTPLKRDWQSRTWMPIANFKAALLAHRPKP